MTAANSLGQYLNETKHTLKKMNISGMMIVRLTMQEYFSALSQIIICYGYGPIIGDGVGHFIPQIKSWWLLLLTELTFPKARWN